MDRLLEHSIRLTYALTPLEGPLDAELASALGVGCDLQLPVQLARRIGQRSGWQAKAFVGGWKVVGKLAG